MPLEQTLRLERVPGVNNGGQLLYIFLSSAKYILQKNKTKRNTFNHNKHRKTQNIKILIKFNQNVIYYM